MKNRVKNPFIYLIEKIEFVTKIVVKVLILNLFLKMKNVLEIVNME